jgi:hypothetical protein
MYGYFRIETVDLCGKREAVGHRWVWAHSRIDVIVSSFPVVSFLHQC